MKLCPKGSRSAAESGLRVPQHRAAAGEAAAPGPILRPPVDSPSVSQYRRRFSCRFSEAVVNDNVLSHSLLGLTSGEKVWGHLSEMGVSCRADRVAHQCRGPPAWIRTTIRASYGGSVTYRFQKGPECRNGPEKPLLVHDPYTGCPGNVCSRRPSSTMHDSL